MEVPPPRPCQFVANMSKEGPAGLLFSCLSLAPPCLSTLITMGPWLQQENSSTAAKPLLPDISTLFLRLLDHQVFSLAASADSIVPSATNWRAGKDAGHESPWEGRSEAGGGAPILAFGSQP